MFKTTKQLMKRLDDVEQRLEELKLKTEKEVYIELKKKKNDGFTLMRAGNIPIGLAESLQLVIDYLDVKYRGSNKPKLIK